MSSQPPYSPVGRDRENINLEMSGEYNISDDFNSNEEGSIPIEHMPKIYRGYSDINEIDNST